MTSPRLTNVWRRNREDPSGKGYDVEEFHFLRRYGDVNPRVKTERGKEYAEQ